MDKEIRELLEQAANKLGVFSLAIKLNLLKTQPGTKDRTTDELDALIRKIAQHLKDN